MRAADDAIIGARAGLWMLLVGGAAFCGMALLLIFGDAVAPSASARNDSYSLSALGHHAFLGLLEERGYPVLRNTAIDPGYITDKDLLIVAEPDFANADEEDITALMEHPGHVLLVLPKWHGEPSSTHQGWVDSVTLLSTAVPEAVAETVMRQTRIARPGDTGPWLGPLAGTPADIDNPQLIVSKDLQVLLGRPTAC